MTHLQPDTSNSHEFNTAPSLVKTFLTPIYRLDVPEPSSPAMHEEISTVTPAMPPTPVQPETDDPLSFIHRMKYFASDPQAENLSSFNENPEFSCAACCRRDEIEQHWRIHYSVDCVLNSSLIQRCPKFQYGCSFQTTRMEPCRANGQPIRLRFDRRNDAIAFEFTPTVIDDASGSVELMDLPSEILMAILSTLDSLSIRNVSLVCSVRSCSANAI